MKKSRLTALVCVLALVCALLPGPKAEAASTVYLLALNDKMCDLPGGLLPVAVNGTVYVPYNTFDNNLTGVDLEVYYGLSQSDGPILSLYSRHRYLTFTVNRGLCVDDQGNEMGFNAVVRSGAVYVPAAAVCGFFGLRCSVLSTEDRGTLVRISNHNASVDDELFLKYARQSMANRYNAIVRKNQDPVPTAPPVPTPRPPELPDDRGHVRVYLAADVSYSDGSFLSRLSPQVPRLLLLFTPDRLSAQSALIRQAVADGHSIGLLVGDGTPEDTLALLEEANELLGHIARIRTRTVSAPGSLGPALEQAGWFLWKPNVSATSTVSGIMDALDAKRSLGRVTVEPSPALISQLAAKLRSSHYTLRQPVETEL